MLEPPDCYVKRIDKRYREQAPRVVYDQRVGDIFVIWGIDKPVPLALFSAAGVDPSSVSEKSPRFEDLPRAGWDPEARLAAQDRDGVAAEILYPSAGMLICKHPDVDYRQACFRAYNRWIAEYCAVHADRLIGVGNVSMRTARDSIAEAREIKQLGLKGIMLPGYPAEEDYDSRQYDPFWEACVDLGLPVTFHHLPGSRDPNQKTDTIYGNSNRGVNSKLNSWMNLIRGNQDLIAMFTFGGVFERHPKLKLVCAEADAGWMPHFMYRMDYAYDHHRHHLQTELLSKAPSDYFRENVYVTFQDDLIALRQARLCNIRRLMWANDYPHFDSTWPHSREVIKEQMAELTDEEKGLILHDNLAACYGLSKPA
ncbi:MAG TPA: amidohydrolase family protein [Candidatus Binataceae bacterium]|nr:amidohydrolase family protein [Candidatus Binataceae bacterium]